MSKHNLGRKSLFQFIVQHEGKSEQELEEETKVKVIEEHCYWLTCNGLLKIAAGSPAVRRLQAPRAASPRQGWYTRPRRWLVSSG